MNLFIYSDESGIFSKKMELFLFAGYIFLNKNEKDKYLNRFKNEEKNLKAKINFVDEELKGSMLNVKQKAKLIKKMNGIYKFCSKININDVYLDIFNSKRTKQRYLDFAYKLGIKNVLKHLIEKNLINPNEIESIYIYQDQHTTTSDGFYELKSSLLQEFKEGIIDVKGNYKKPIFHNLKRVEVKLCDSKKNVLIRASDVLCNLIWNNFKHHNGIKNLLINNLYIIELPYVKKDVIELTNTNQKVEYT